MNSARSSVSLWSGLVGFVAALGAGRDAVLRLCELVLGLLVVGGLASVARAQCVTQWLPGDGLPGFNGTVYATTMWDRDGAGPLPPLLVVGGSFTIASNCLANNIATYEPISGVWAPLGSGVSNPTNQRVTALTTLPNGDLVAGGIFSSAGGVSVGNVARWDGNSWSALGSGVNNSVSALASLPSGDLVVGGGFTMAGGTPASRIARWDGSTWSALGLGTDSRVRALATMPNGDLVAGGDFTTAGGVLASGVASWNGTAWSALGQGVSGGCYALKAMPNGDLVAGGFFTDYLARWDGANWVALYADGPVISIAVLANGDLVISARPVLSSSYHHVSQWNGANWVNLSEFNSRPVHALTVLPNGYLAAGGEFTSLFNQASAWVGAWRFALWDGAAWSSPGRSTDASIASMATMPNGDLLVAGSFSRLEGVVASCIARWNGVSWTPLGPGLSGPVHALLVLPNGDLVAGGEFTGAGSVSVNRIARWDGAVWSAMGSGIDGPVFALARMSNGDIVAGGNFTMAGGGNVSSVARWNGSSWSGMGLVIGYSVTAFASRLNGDLVAAHWGPFGGATIARWDGLNWSPMGSGLGGGPGVGSYVNVLATRSNGDLLAGGSFYLGNGLVRWSGASWAPVGLGPNSAVTALGTMPNGDLVVGGDIATAGGIAVNNLASWNGTSWSTLGSELGIGCSALSMGPNGDLVAGGSFLTAGGQVSAYLARLTTTCPATATTTGPGCTGSGGPNTFEAQNLPWIGSTFRARSTTVPSLALAAIVTGFTTANVSLSSVLPPSRPGCNILVTPDSLEFAFSNGGTVDTTLPIPNSSSLVGLQLFRQLVLLEMDQNNAFLESTSSNALGLVVGAF